MFRADRDADSVWGGTGSNALFFGQLLVGRGPGVDGKGLGVANAVEKVERLACLDDK